MKPSQFIETADKSARRDPAQSRNEIRSIDWLSRANVAQRLDLLAEVFPLNIRRQFSAKMAVLIAGKPDG